MMKMRAGYFRDPRGFAFGPGLHGCERQARQVVSKLGGEPKTGSRSLLFLVGQVDFPR